jgi:CHAT domain-containing protein
VVLARSYREQGAGLDVTRSHRALYGWLPGALAEAGGVANALNAVSYLEQEADRDHFRRALGAGVLWFIGHVDSHDPRDPALVLARGPESDLLSLRELVAASPAGRSGLDMAVLSSCGGAAGPAGVGEGLVGLAWAMQQAGAKSVVGCVWDLDDQAGRQLMTGFARNLGRGMGRAEALRRAQRALMTDRAYRHPYYWASPVLFGRSDALGPVAPPSPSWRPAAFALLLAALAAGGWYWRTRSIRSVRQRVIRNA